MQEGNLLQPGSWGISDLGQEGVGAEASLVMPPATPVSGAGNCGGVERDCGTALELAGREVEATASLRLKIKTSNKERRQQPEGEAGGTLLRRHSWPGCLLSLKGTPSGSELLLPPGRAGVGTLRRAPASALGQDCPQVHCV